MLVLVLGWPFLLTLGERLLPAAGSLLAGVLLTYFFKVYLTRKAVDPDDDL
ncbi:hypothetical protein D3C73_1639210 [compost metagenome]